VSAARRYRRVEDLEGEQRAAALAEGDAVIAAGAGSGKTTVLAARYVRLLEEGRLPSGERVHARNILVLTFTRKAAAEMYSRIYGSLAEAAALARERYNKIPLGSGDSHVAVSAALARERYNKIPLGSGDSHVAEHLESCLRDFAEAQISTFDSFAARVARSGSARFGLAPDFAVDEDRARELASELALAFLLGHRDRDAVRDLVSAAGFEGARDEILAELATSRMSLSSPPDFALFHEAQARRLVEMEADSRASVLALRAAALDYADAKTTATSRAWLEALASDPGEGAEGLLAFIGRLDGLRKPGSNSRDEASLFLCEAVPSIRAAVASYRDIDATLRAHPARRELYLLLDEFRKEWDGARRAEKILTFRDVAQLALDVLETDGETLEHYRSLYRYAMIDEFQDDDELQKRVLFLLAGDRAGKLFFVGDEKQSIYLFRGADVSMFRRLASELRPSGPASGPTSLSLSKNYRSEPGLIGVINSIFEELMPPPGEPAEDSEGRKVEDFEARFEALASREATGGVEPRFVYLELPRPEDGGDENRGAFRETAEAEAWAVARIVRDAVERGSLLVADRKTGKARAARYEDFAILLRSTGNQVHFEKYFRLLDVPYGAENACGLFSEAVACDLYYALRLALYPEDRNALAAYLRSPFAGLSDEALVRFLCSTRGLFDPEVAALLPSRDRPGWERGVATIRAVSAMADKASLAACLSFLWFEAGYRSALLREKVASAFEEHFELVHSLAVEADARGRCLASFVAGLERLVGRPDKLEIDLPRDDRAGVRIMTVHKSKGLEFPVVIIPQANNVGREGSAREPWYWEEGLGPSFRPPAEIGSRSRNAFFEAARGKRTAMERAELKRLLYVALTRAESHIVVSAVRPRAEDREGRSFRSLLAQSLGLLDAPSPLASSPAESAGSASPPFGPLVTLPSGAHVGVLRELREEEYLGLVSRSRHRRAGGREAVPNAAGPPLVERLAMPASEAVSSLAERYSLARAAEGGEAQRANSAERLEIDRELEAPKGLRPELWGSLVHALLESKLRPGGRGLELSSTLRGELRSALGSDGALGAAIERAALLAQVFLGSELGRRALAAGDRRVELKIAMGYKGAARFAKGSVDLAFIEPGHVVVVDYKTDAAIDVGAHDFQLAAYRRAAAEIFALPAEAWVFYLYGGGRAMRLPERGAPELEDAPDPPPAQAKGFGAIV
jgi:ATP-dependent helicase/nuclease subunit A